MQILTNNNANKLPHLTAAKNFKSKLKATFHKNPTTFYQNNSMKKSKSSSCV
jgi:hypothetical protein